MVGIGSETNKGFEGLSWDDDGQRLLVVKERNPMRVIEVTGFVSFVVGEPIKVGIREIKSPDSPELFMRDLHQSPMSGAWGTSYFSAMNPICWWNTMLQDNPSACWICERAGVAWREPSPRRRV